MTTIKTVMTIFRTANPVRSVATMAVDPSVSWCDGILIFISFLSIIPGEPRARLVIVRFDAQGILT